jgi:orotate phosphoribosyltransferase
MNEMTTTTKKQELISLLKNVGGKYRETPIVLATGEKTHVYLDVKGVLDRGSRLNLAADAMIDHLYDETGFKKVTAIGGPTMGADVIAHTIVGRVSDYHRAIAQDLRWFAIRDHAKTDHGLGKWIEGAELGADDKVIITDDVANSGKSLVEAVERVQATGAKVLAVVPLVDRSDQTAAKIEALGIPYLPLLTSEDIGIAPLKAM